MRCSCCFLMCWSSASRWFLHPHLSVGSVRMSRSRQITNLSRALRAPSRTPRAAASTNIARIANSPLRTATQLPSTVKTRTSLAAHQTRSFLTTAPRSQDAPQSISDEQYHEIADNFLESALKTVDEAMEHRDDLDLEFEVGSTFHYMSS